MAFLNGVFSWFLLFYVKVFFLTLTCVFLFDLPIFIPVILYKQMFYILIQTYFCKSCTKTYNFLPKNTDSENTFSRRCVLKNIFRLCARWQAVADYDYGIEGGVLYCIVGKENLESWQSSQRKTFIKFPSKFIIKKLNMARPQNSI